MRIVFFGTSEFAVPSLEKLSESRHEVVLVVTQPDRRKGRHLKLSAPPVKEYASKKDIKIFQPKSLSKDFVDSIKKLKPDLFVVIAYGHILKKELLDVPKALAINVHASLLPKYRGAAPVDWAIINGETETGVTIIRMNEKIDEGDIVLQKKIKIPPEDTALSLRKKLSELGAAVLIEALELIETGKAGFAKQDEGKATYAPKLKKEDGLVDWKLSALEAHNRVRGLDPWPGAYTHWQGRMLKIWKTEVLKEEAKELPGKVIEADKDRIKVATGNGILAIKELQLEGKKRMDAKDFLSGHSLRPGEEFA